MRDSKECTNGLSLHASVFTGMKLHVGAQKIIQARWKNNLKITAVRTSVKVKC